MKFEFKAADYKRNGRAATKALAAAVRLGGQSTARREHQIFCKGRCGGRQTSLKYRAGIMYTLPS
jgi:hypothetical protein